MTWPNAATKTHLDQSSDDPKQARSELADLVDKFNALRGHVSSFMQTVLSRTTASAARADLELETVGQAEAEAGTATTTRAFTAERMAQAIANLATRWPATEKTVASGSITPTKPAHTVDTESDASSDDLDTLATGSVAAGHVVVLTAQNAARVVTAKHGAGNLDLADGKDFALDAAQKAIALQLRGSTWYELWRTPVTARVVQQVYAETAAHANDGGNNIAGDDSLPQITEGAEAITVAITPTSASNILLVEAVAHCDRGASATQTVAALFKDSAADALSVGVIMGDPQGANTVVRSIPVSYRAVAGGTSEITFRLRYGSNGNGTTYLNGISSGRRYGGALRTWIRVTELTA